MALLFFHDQLQQTVKDKTSLLRTSTALTVSDKQSKELAKLIECISSSEEGQEAVKVVCNEADEQPRIGAILKELWELEREAFFKDQRKEC